MFRNIIIISVEYVTLVIGTVPLSCTIIKNAKCILFYCTMSVHTCVYVFKNIRIFVLLCCTFVPKPTTVLDTTELAYAILQMSNVKNSP